MDMYPSSMTSSAITAPPPAKAVKKVRNNAIAIVDPKSGKNIMDDFLSESSQPADVQQSQTPAPVVAPVTAELKAPPQVPVEEVASIVQTVEEEVPVVVPQVEPQSTPVVSANTDGPSVDITPKHQVIIL